MIPRRLFTVWMGDAMPPLVQHCIATQAALEGYEHRVVTETNHGCDSRYLREAIEARRWCKASDYLRIWLLEREGGIYLDADIEVVGTFDDMLVHAMFAGSEQNGWISNAVLGSEPHTPLLRRQLEIVDANFIGSGDLVLETGMYPFNALVRSVGGIVVYDPEYFHPYDHMTGNIVRTDNTRTYHHFMLSWAGQ